MKEIKKMIAKKNRFNVYELENNFDEACDDDTFKRLLVRLNFQKMNL